MSEIKIKYNTYPSIENMLKNIESIVDNNVHRLDMIQSTITLPIVCDLDEIFKKIELISKGADITLTDFEQGNLSFHFYEMKEDNVNFYLNKYLTNNWNKVCIKGLLHSITQYYHNNHLIEQLRKIVYSHIDDLTPVELLAFEYLHDKNGTKNLAEYLRNNKFPVIKAPTYVLLQSSMFSYCFFEDVMLEYFSKYDKFTTELDFGLETALITYNKRHFNKIIIPKILIRISKQPVSEYCKTYFIKLGKTMIGDPNNKSLWQDNTLKETESNALIKAHHIIRSWILGNAISRVLKGSSNDYYELRSRFWERYASTLLKFNQDALVDTFFRVYTSDQNKINYLRNLGWNNFYQLRTQSETIVLMRFGEYTIAEFLSGGCMYVYKNRPTPRCPYNLVWSKDREYEAEQFKRTDTELLHMDTRGNIPNEDFKIAHRGEWTRIFKHLLTLLGITTNQP